MTKLHVLLFTTWAATLSAACSSSSDTGSSSGGTGGLAQTGGGGAAPMAGGGATAMAGGGVAGSASAGAPSAGAAGASGGASSAGSGGAPPSGGGGSSGASAGATTGGGGSGGSAGSGAAGASGAGAGGGGNPTLKGGASAAFVCEPGKSYGNPLEGMGAVTTINPPTMGPATYFAFIEGPVWVGSVGKLFFSDNASSPDERIWVLTPPSTTPQVFMEKSGSNGLAIDNDDKLILADQRGKRITRVDPTAASPMAEVVAPAGNYTPNDLIVRSDGNIYFTDPQSGGRGFYRVSPAGMVSGPITAVNNPNGIVLSPDETKLYVGDVQNRSITTFTVAADGAVMPTGTPFATTMGDTLDGMAVDCAGNVYAGTGSGVEVFSPMGMRIGAVPTGESSNATFGGADRKTLYVTSRAVLKAVTLAVPGLPN